MNDDSIKVVDSFLYFTPKGKIVYGGGGFIPDVFVSIDTTYYFPDFHYQRARQFAFRYFDENVEEFKEWSLDRFLIDFDRDEHIFTEYMATIPSEYSHLEVEERNNLKLFLKAVFAQQVFDVNAYYKVINEQDKMIEKVIELDKEGYPIDP